MEEPPEKKERRNLLANDEDDSYQNKAEKTFDGHSIDQEDVPIIIDHETPSRYWCCKYFRIKFLHLITGFVAVGGFLFGFDTGVISGAILLLEDDFDLSSWEIELVVSIALVGAIIGSIMGSLADRWGRRIVIAVASTFFLLGSLILGASLNKYMLMAGRLVVGVGIGLAANLVPLYIAEVAPTETRGSLVTTNNLCLTTGIFISYLVDSAFVDVPEGWRYMLGLGAVPAFIQLLGLAFVVPESPRWLLTRSHAVAGEEGEEYRVKAIGILQRIRGKEKNIEEELREIEESIKMESQGGWRELLSPAVRPALIVGIGLQAFQQFCGINTAMYYSPTILKKAGFDDDAVAIWFANLVAFANAIFTVVAIYLIDRMGRRKLLLVSITGLTIGLVFLGFSFFFEHEYAGYMAIASLVFYVAFFAIGMGPIPWTVNSEIYPPSVRGLGNGVATTTNWSANLLVSMTFLSYVGWVSAAGAFWSYAGIGVLAWIFMYLLLPETKDKSIEEIQEVLRAQAVANGNKGGGCCGYSK